MFFCVWEMLLVFDILVQHLGLYFYKHLYALLLVPLVYYQMILIWCSFFLFCHQLLHLLYVPIALFVKPSVTLILVVIITLALFFTVRIFFQIACFMWICWNCDICEFSAVILFTICCYICVFISWQQFEFEYIPFITNMHFVHIHA